MDYDFKEAYSRMIKRREDVVASKDGKAVEGLPQRRMPSKDIKAPVVSRKSQEKSA